MQNTLVGIIGGVGPLSHIQFEQEILQEGYQRGARKDQDYPEWILINASKTPDRTTALLQGGEDPGPHLIKTAKQLEKAGASHFFVICNTAHALYEQVQSQVKIPWVHLMKNTVDYIKKIYPRATKVGVLATDGTLQTELYKKALEEKGLIQIAPENGSRLQLKVMEAIYNKEYGIKATGASISTQAREYLIEAAMYCWEEGADVIICGCTEISLSLTHEVFSGVPLIDPLKVAAKAFWDLVTIEEYN